MRVNFRFRRPSPAMAVASVALTIGAAGASWAAIPDRQGAINGCYNNDTGALRVADPETGVPRSCGVGETALNWGLPQAFSVTRVKQIKIPKETVFPANIEMVRLNLPPGRYLVQGSAMTNYATKTPLGCVLQSTDPQGSGRADEAHGTTGTLHLNIVAEITAPGQYAFIKCARRFRHQAGQVDQRPSIVFPKISAIEVGKVTHTFVRD